MSFLRDAVEMKQDEHRAALRTQLAESRLE